MMRPAPNRRLFLRSVLSGGLLLPWSGRQALAVANVDAAGSIPLQAQPLPVSAGCQAMRDLRRALAACHAQPHSDARSAEWMQLMLQYSDRVHELAAQPIKSWTDCVALAEVAWHFSPKAERFSADGEHEWLPRLRARTPGQPGPLGRPTSAPIITWVTSPVYDAASAALIEGILALGAGERLDPRVRHS